MLDLMAINSPYMPIPNIEKKGHKLWQKNNVETAGYSLIAVTIKVIQ